MQSIFRFDRQESENKGGRYVKERFRKGWKAFKKQRELQLFAWIGMVVLFIFSYLPLSGILIAFKDYKIQMGFSGIWTADWVGLKWFKCLPAFSKSFLHVSSPFIFALLSVKADICNPFRYLLNSVKKRRHKMSTPFVILIY